jgi:hypothetical protein
MSFEPDEQNLYRSAAEIEAVRRDFESCAFAPDHFKHRQHLVVALLYLTEVPLPVARERLRANLLRFLRHHSVDVQVYHETITLFWLKRVRSFLDTQQPRPPLVELVNRLLEALPDANLIHNYYSKERLATDEARTAWLEPDLPEQ